MAVESSVSMRSKAGAVSLANQHFVPLQLASALYLMDAEENLRRRNFTTGISHVNAFKRLPQSYFVK